MPYPYVGGRVARAFVDAFQRTRSAGSLGPVLAGAVVLTALLALPVVGPWLGLAAVAGIVAVWYGPMVREAGRDLCAPHDRLWGDARDNRPTDDARLLDTSEITAILQERMAAPPRTGGRRVADLAARGALGLLAVAALVGPVVLRDGGLGLPVGTGNGLGLTALVVAALAWTVMPIVLLVAFAHDRRGPLAARLTLPALARHPFATLASWLALPVGLVLIEGLLAVAAWDQGFLAVLTADLAPPPQAVGTPDGTHLVFNFEGRALDRNLSAGPAAVVDVYPTALRHGYSLVGGLPLSLSTGMAVRMYPPAFGVGKVPYYVMRLILTAVTLTLLGSLLALQGRWLGIVAALGARRPAGPPVPRRTPVPTRFSMPPMPLDRPEPNAPEALVAADA